MADLLRADYADIRRKASDFLESSHGESYLDSLRAAMMQDGKKRITFDLGDLRKYDEGLVRSLLRNPVEVIPPFEEALREKAREEAANLDDDARKKAVKALDEQLRMGFTGPFGFHRVTPRELLSTFLNTLVRVEGIVTKASLIAPKLQQSVHYCEATKKYTVRNYADVTSLTALPTGSAYPTKDDAGNPLTTEYGLCRFVNYQSITIQEAPETAPPGQLPRSVDVMLEGDLTDLAKPGDRVSLVGVYRAAPQKATGTITGVMRAVVVASHVEVLSGQAATVTATPDEVAAMRRFVAEVTKKGSNEMLRLLSESLAPSIKGHQEVKMAMLLQLVGGVGKQLENGTRLRGDINLLLVGDPGVAKSQLLRAAMKVAPLAVSTTGRGSSGVGLTAAVTQDRETGERRLEAGAMVLADRGIVCIDEFDKMSDVDRVAIHEVMEQQTVTIAKAGIHTTLNARCSVLAAANPIYGSYDPKISLPRNINLPDSLLSRFDLLFVMVDAISATKDKEIAEHVVRMHCLAAAHSSARGALDVRDQLAVEEAGRLAVDDGEEMDTEDKFYMSRTARLAANGTKLFKPSFIRKYVAYVRSRMKPAAFTEEAQVRIKDMYAELRASHRDDAGIPITARMLETIIRLATAHAKLRLDAKTITAEDVEAASDILHCALFSEPLKDKERRRQREREERARAKAGAAAEEAEPSEEVYVPRKRARVEGAEAEAVRRAAEAEAAAALPLVEGAGPGPEPDSQEELLRPVGRPDLTHVVRALSERDRDILERALGQCDDTLQTLDDFMAMADAQGSQATVDQVRAYLRNARDTNRVVLTEEEDGMSFVRI